MSNANIFIEINLIKICNDRYNIINLNYHYNIMAGRPKHNTDDELIDRAIKVFWEKGYHAASAKDLLKGMDIGQGSFYRSFPGGKKELYQKSMIRFLEKANKAYFKGLEESDCPITHVQNFFNVIPLRNKEEMYNGCYLGNAIVELSNLDEESIRIATNLLNKLKDGFEKALVMAQEEGKLDSGKSPRTLALYLINLWNGINVTNRMNFSKKELKSVLGLSLQVLD